MWISRKRKNLGIREDRQRRGTVSRVAKQSGEVEWWSRGEGGVKDRGRDDVIVEGCPGNGEAVRRRVGTPSCVATAAAT